MEVDEASGLVQRLQAVQKIQGTVKMDAGAAGKMTWPISIESTVRVEPLR